MNTAAASAPVHATPSAGPSASTVTPVRSGCTTATTPAGARTLSETTRAAMPATTIGAAGQPSPAAIARTSPYAIAIPGTIAGRAASASPESGRSRTATAVIATATATVAS
jgi:hypothetical protein